MTPPPSFAKPLLTLFNQGTAVGLTDLELLRRFATRDDSAESAFAVLIERHGGMVLKVCRSVVRNLDDADDAFQATFMVLARKARTVRAADSLAPWLFGVARKVSLRASASSQRRGRFLKRLAEGSREPSREGTSTTETTALIREELERLPRRYQTAVRLCDLDGFSREEAAEALGLPVGTVKSRLSRGRSKLRERLLRRGVSPESGCCVPIVLTHTTLPPRLAALTIRAALWEIQNGTAASGVAATAAVALTEGTVQAMFMTKIKIGLLVAASAGVFAGGALVRNQPGAAFGAFAQEPADFKEAPKAVDIQTDGDESPPLPAKSVQQLMDEIPSVPREEELTPQRWLSIQREQLQEKKLQNELALLYAAKALELLEKSSAQPEDIAMARRKQKALRDQGELIDRVAESLGTEPLGFSPAASLKRDDFELNHLLAVQEAQIAVKQAVVDRSRAEVDDAASKLDYIEKLNQKGFVSHQGMQTSKTALAVATADLHAAEAELKLSRHEMDRLKAFQTRPELMRKSSRMGDSSLDAMKIEDRFNAIESKLDRLLKLNEESNAARDLKR